MKKLFKKFAIAMIGLLTSVGVANMSSSNNKAAVAEAASVSTATLKLSPSYWGSASAYYTIHYWGGNTSSTWPGSPFNNGEAASGDVEITADYDITSTHCIIIRWNNSSFTDEGNRWDYFDGNSFGTGVQYNYFTNTAWNSCSSKYVAPPSTTYVVKLYDGEDLKKSEDVAEGTKYVPSFYEKEGYRFDGWYTDASLTTAFVKGTAITGDTNLYAKYVAAEDYTVYFKDSESVLGDDVYVYTYRSLDGGENASWPGEKITKNEDGKYVIDIDASKSYDTIIFNNGNPTKDKKQTDNISLVGTKNGDTFVLGELSNGKYNAALEEYVTINIYDGETLKDTIQHIKGTKYYAPFKAKAGYRLLGYYTDASLETPYVNGTVANEPINLYAKYEVAKTTTFYVDITAMAWEEKGTLSLHMWSDNFANDHDVTEPLTKISTDFYSVTLNSEISYDRFQFHNSNGSYTKTMYLDYTADGTYIILAPDQSHERWHHDVDYVAPVVKAHIANEEVDVTVKHLTTDAADTVEKVTATTTGISLIRYAAGNYAFSSEVSEEAKVAALKEYFAKVDTCADYANADEYAALVALVSNGRDLVITETVGDNAELTIGAKLDYLSYMKANNSTVSPTSNNLLDLGNKKNTIGFIGLVSILGLVSIAGYYFLNKKKEA